MKDDHPTDVQSPSPRAQVRIPDHELLRVIGRGSYGEVWEARNVMGTHRAVKIVKRQDFDYARPFDREVEGIMRYEPISRSHAGLVQVLHVGMGPDQEYFYYVMELGDADPEASQENYVPKTLRSEMRRVRSMPVAECIEIGITLASGLGHLHRNGLVHRDVKPSNIIYVNGAPKLADVGLVAFMSDTRSIVGTEGYLAPDGTGQPRSDVYSLGKVLYECITGLDRQQFPDVPTNWGSAAAAKAAFEFMEIVLRAAESNPARRYADTTEMLSDLALLKAGKSLRYLRRVETRLKRAGQILAFSALGLSIAGGAWWYERHKRGQVETAESAANQAQQKTQQLLAASLLAEARAVRLSGQAGAREKALDAVRRGLQAGAPPLELRSQAASALALTDVGALDLERMMMAPGHRCYWSPCSKFAVLTAMATGSTRIVARDSGQETASFETAPNVREIAVADGARWVATLHSDTSLRLWDSVTGKCAWTQRDTRKTCPPAFSRDGSWLVSSTDAGLVARACAGGEPLLIAPRAPAMRAIYLAPNGAWLAALTVPVLKEGEPSQELGFRIYTGLPGRMPSAAELSAITEHTIESDIQLEGASISADSRYLAAAVSEDRLRVWEMPAMSQVAWLRGHQRSVRGTAFHPHDSNIVASTSWDGTTQLWDIPTRKQIMILPLGGERLVLSPDRGEILLRSWDGDTIYSAPLSSRSALRVLGLPAQIPFGLFSGLAFNASGSLLAAAGDAGVIGWSTATGVPFVVQTPLKPDQWRDVSFSPDGAACYFSGKEGLFRRSIGLDPAGTVVLGSREQVLTGYASFMQWCGNTLAISGRFNANNEAGVALLRPDGSQRHLASAQNPDRLAASLDGRWLVVSDYAHGGGTLWDLSTEPPAATSLAAASRAAFGFTTDSATLLTSTDVRITFSRAAQPHQTVAPPLSRRDCQVVPAHSASSKAAGLTAISTGPNEITLCNGQTLEPILKLDSPLTPFDSSLAFSPDGTQLALAGGVSRVIIWDLAWIKEQLDSMGLGW